MTSRMPDLADGWIRPAVRWARANGPWNVVVSTYGPYATHCIGMQLKKKKIAEFWAADYRDLWTDNHAFPGLFPFTLIERFLERYSMKWADLITTVSDPLARVLAAKYGRKRVEVIENGFDSLDLERLEPSSVFPHDKKVRIVYTGTIYGDKQDVTPLFGAIAALAREPETRVMLSRFEVVFCGDRMSDLDDQIERYHLSEWAKNVGLLPRETALRMQRDAHILLFLEWDDKVTDGVLTGKLFEYMASGTPIWSIGTDRETVAGKLISRAGAGVCLGRDESLIKEALAQVLSDGKKSPSLVDPQVLDGFERKHLANRLLRLMEERMGKQLHAS